MEKQKIDWAKYTDMHEVKQMTGKDGTVVNVRSHIPWAQKIEAAKELAENVIMTHDDSCVYEGHNLEIYKEYILLKYYTDVDMEDVTPEQAADFMINNEFVWPDETADDFWEIVAMYKEMYKMFETTFNDDVSLAKAVRTSFGFLFNGEDITESMAKAEMTKDIIYRAFNALQEKEEEAGRNITDGKARIGGTLLNFAKKRE